MISNNYIGLRNPNISNKINSEYKETFRLSKKHKNNFREYSNLSQKKHFYKKPNIYSSFINSSAPFIYYKDPSNKNTFIINYNGGPKKQIHIFKKTDDYKNDLNEKQIIYRNYKPCGYLSNNYMPKLSRSLSYNEYFKNNYINMKKSHYNNYNKVYLSPSNNGLRSFKRSMTPNNFRMTKDGKIVLTLKKFRDENNHEENNNIRYESQKKYENNEYNENNVINENNENNEINENNEKDKSRNKFNSSFYNFRPRIFNSFHKTQIFNHCKPFLVDQFQEFPD